MRLFLLLLAGLLCVPALVRADDAVVDPCKTLVAESQPAPPPDTKGKKSKPKKDKDANNLVPLGLAICEVQRALDAYQDDPTVAKGDLPKLLTADFDFKTVLDTKASFGISILVFKIGVSYDKQTTNDVDFQYEPKSRHKGPEAAALPKNFQQELIDTIKAAAKATFGRADNEQMDIVLAVARHQWRCTIRFAHCSGDVRQNDGHAP